MHYLVPGKMVSISFLGKQILTLIKTKITIVKVSLNLSQITSEKEKSELAKQWMIIDGSKLMQNHLTPIVSSENSSKKKDTVTTNENVTKHDEKPELLPKRKGEIDNLLFSISSNVKSLIGSQVVDTRS